MGYIIMLVGFLVVNLSYGQINQSQALKNIDSITKVLQYKSGKYHTNFKGIQSSDLHGYVMNGNLAGQLLDNGSGASRLLGTDANGNLASQLLDNGSGA